MQSLFKSIIETVTPSAQTPGTVVTTTSDTVSSDSLTPNPLHLADGPDYVSLPAGQGDEELTLSATLASISTNISSFASSESMQQLQNRLEQLKQNPQLVSLKSKLSTAAAQIQETALEVARDMNKELSYRLQGEFSFDPESPEYREHPLRFLPWERPGEQWGELVGEELFTEAQIERAVKDVICQVTKDPEFLSLPPPPHYVFVMDRPRQRYAFEVLKFDKHLEHLRYQLVPKKFHEEDFWLIYFWKLEQLLATFPAGFRERLESVKFEDSQAEVQAANREKALQDLINEERASLGTLPVSVIPEFLNPSKLQEFLQSTTTVVFGGDTKQSTTPPPPPPAPATTEIAEQDLRTQSKAERSLEARDEGIKAADSIAANMLALDDDDEAIEAMLGTDQIAAASSEALDDNKHHTWVSPLEKVPDDDLEEFEKQLLGES